ncbi:MAG TPA: hypothetical protein VFA74_04300 [Terriglobales bacterium]|nr:hypothetical protein [Terriglobales bacterium]
MVTSTNYKKRTCRTNSWGAVLILVAVCSLTISLTTRYNSYVNASSVGVKQVTDHSTAQKRQHLDKDAVRYAAPALRFVTLEVSTFYPRFAPSGPPVHALLLDERLYNRPPPTADLLS